MEGKLLEVLNFNWLILKLNWFICNWQLALPIHWIVVPFLFITIEGHEVQLH